MILHITGAMEKKIRENAVYISLLPDDITEEKIGEHFGSIGVIKVRHSRIALQTWTIKNSNLFEKGQISGLEY